MKWEIRPLEKWPYEETSPRSAIRFKASWDQTVELLGRETELLGAELVVVQVDVLNGDIRRDGMLTARARVGHPGVIVSFGSFYGPLSYATDEFLAMWTGDMPSWQANVRAIALSLEALRAVDRYGVTRRGEQYQGWTQLTSRPAEMTRDQAAEFIAQWAEPDDAGKRFVAVGAMLRSPELFVQKLYLRAAKRAHPDLTGDDGDTMARLNQARDIIIGRNPTNA